MKIDWFDFFDALLLAIGLIWIFVPIIMMSIYGGSPLWMFGWVLPAVTLSFNFGRKKAK